MIATTSTCKTTMNYGASSPRRSPRCGQRSVMHFHFNGKEDDEEATMMPMVALGADTAGEVGFKPSPSSSFRSSNCFTQEEAEDFDGVVEETSDRYGHNSGVGDHYLFSNKNHHHSPPLSLLDSCESFDDNEEDEDVLLPSMNINIISDKTGSSSSIFIKRRRCSISKSVDEDDDSSSIHYDYCNPHRRSSSIKRGSFLSLKRANPVYDDDDDEEEENRDDSNEENKNVDLEEISDLFRTRTRRRRTTTTTVVVPDGEEGEAGVEVTSTTITTLLWNDRVTTAAIAA